MGASPGHESLGSVSAHFFISPIPLHCDLCGMWHSVPHPRTPHEQSYGVQTLTLPSVS